MPPRPSLIRPNHSQPIDKKLGAIGRIQDIGFAEDDPIQVLVYGRSGTGKTTLWSTFPGPILALICSGGLNPGELRSIDTAENRGKIKSLNVQSSTDVTEIVNYLKTNPGKFNTIVLDHASGFQDLVLKEILGLEEVPVVKTFGLARIQDYGQCTIQCKEIMRSLIGLPMNVFIVAQERDFNNESDNQIIAPTVGASLTPILTGWLNTAVDYILNTYIRQKEVVQKITVQGKTREQRIKTKEVEYCLRTAPNAIYTTKFRLPKGAKLPDVIVDPDYNKLIEVIRGNLK